MGRIPFLKLGQFLLVTIQVDMYDKLALQLQDDIAQQVVKHRARGVLIDISALEVVDSFIGRILTGIAGTARMLNAETVLVGMQPAVAITLVELGMNLPGVRLRFRGRLAREREEGKGARAGPRRHPAKPV